MRETFNTAFQLVIGHEGNFTADRRDRGNWTSGRIGKGELKGTKFGVSAMSYPDLDIKNLTVAQAKEIYLRDFWIANRCDELPAGLDYLVFDMAINHGGKQAIKFLQIGVGAEPDGAFGPRTLARVNKVDVFKAIREVAAQRMKFYVNLKTFETYGMGWTRRAIDTAVFATGIALESKQ